MVCTCVHKDYYLKSQNTAIPYGPIIIYKNGQSIQVALVSVGLSCRLPHSISVLSSSNPIYDDVT